VSRRRQCNGCIEPSAADGMSAEWQRLLQAAALRAIRFSLFSTRCLAAALKSLSPGVALRIFASVRSSMEGPLAIGRPASGPGPSSAPENAGCPQAANRTERLFSANACFLGGFLPISERTRRRKNEAGKARGAQGRNRTTDTAIFSRMLYQLSYLGRSLGRKSPSSRRVIGGANGAVYRPKADCFHIPAGPTASSCSSPATTAKA
jgi:hypothetical protein